MDPFSIFQQTKRQRVSDGQTVAILSDVQPFHRLLVVLLPQLGDFDSLEYAWWLTREADKTLPKQITLRAIGIGDRNSGQRFCQYTGFPSDCLFTDSKGDLHCQLLLYPGLSLKIPGFSPAQNASLGLLLMCAGIGSPGTLKEVFRGYLGDKSAPQLINDDEVVQAFPLPSLKGKFFQLAGGSGFQRPFELATLRLRNMAEVLGNWRTYVPDATYLTQRGATFYFDAEGNLLYQYRDNHLLGFAENMSEPLAFLEQV